MLKYSIAILSALALAGATISSAFPDAKGKKIAHLTTAIQLPYISTLAKSLSDAGASYGMEVTVFSSPFDPAIQSQQMDDAVAGKFAMIILTAVSEQAIVPALTRAQQAGIPVIALIDPPKPGTEKLYTSFVGDDQPELGHIAAVTGALQEGVAPLRLNAFKEVIKQDPKVELVAVEDVAWDTAKSEQA